MNSEIPVALILCGGMATRLGKLCTKTPKALMVVNGITVIDIIIDKLKSQNFEKIILCAGHLHDQLLEKFKSTSHIQISVENYPLGTGGAIRQAIKHVNTDLFFVMNGDTISNVDYLKLWNHHLKVGKSATVAITKKTERFDSSNIKIEHNLVKRFYKNIDQNESIEEIYENAGTYLFTKESISMHLYPKVFSLEDIMLPRLAENNDLAYWLLDKAVLDIGTPERLNYANRHQFE